MVYTTVWRLIYQRHVYFLGYDKIPLPILLVYISFLYLMVCHVGVHVLRRAPRDVEIEKLSHFLVETSFVHVDAACIAKEI